LFVVEGRLIVRRLLPLIAAGQFELTSLLVTSTALQALSDVLPDSLPWPVYVCRRSVVRAVTGFNFHRGCLALARRPNIEMTIDRLPDSPRLIALEGVGNPDNVGGLFRVAGTLTVGGVILDRTCADPLYRKAIRTSMGATLRVPFVRVQDWLSALSQLRTRGYRLIALTPDPEAVSLETLKPTARDRLVLMLGSEGSGLQPATLALADARVRIPMDPDADSLNVVVAAAIALHALQF